MRDIQNTETLHNEEQLCEHIEMIEILKRSLTARLQFLLLLLERKDKLALLSVKLRRF